MTRTPLIALGALALVAGCVGGPPFTEGSFAAGEGATNSCRALMRAQTTDPVRVVGSQVSEDGSEVFMRVGEAGALWRCRANDDGSGASVSPLPG